MFKCVGNSFLSGALITSIFVVLCDFLGTRVLFGRIFVWLVVSLGCEGSVAWLFPIRSRRSGYWV